MTKQLLTILTILFLFNTNLAFSQLSSVVDNVNVKIGAQQKFEAKSKFISSDETGCYMLRKLIVGSDFVKYPKYWLEHFNMDANPTRLVQLEIREKGEKHRLEKVLMLDDQLFLISFLKDKKAKEVTFFAQSINKKDFSIKPQRKKIYTIDISENDRQKVVFNYQISPDQKSLLVYSTDFGKAIYNNAYDFKVFDQQMDLVYKVSGGRVNTFHYQNTLNDLVLDNSQNVYVLTSNIEIEVKKKMLEKYMDETISSRARIIRFKNEGQQIDSVSLDFEDYKMEKGQLLINDDGTFTCLGNLTKTKRRLISGTFYCIVDFDKLEVSPIKYNAFDQKLLLGTSLDEDHKEQQRSLRKNGECPLENYLNMNIVKSNKGAFYLISEKVDALESTTTSGEEGFLGGGQTTKTTGFCFFKTLVITKYSKGGDYIWTSKVPKHTMFKNITIGGTETYAAKAIDDDLYLFFGDTKKRIGYKRDINLPKSTSKHFVALVKIDESGNYKKKSIMNSKKKAHLFGIGQLALDERELILQVSTFKTRQLVRLRFD